MTAQAEVIPVVVSTKDMDDETFRMHMRRRHPEDMGGLDRVDKINGSLEIWRKFHDKVHELRPRINQPHEHE
jgi:hypothetical protein